LCRGLGIATVADETNDDPAHQRNRVRHELIPLLASVSRRDPVPVLVRTADVLRDDDALLDELASHIDVTDAVALAAAPLPLARRAVRMWLADPYPPDLATVDRVLEVARGRVPGCDIGGNRQIRRSKQRMTIVDLG
ncbi:MAG: tRNA(Ile)-lysidine synthase, partial [Actinomycetota bacterium]